MSRFGYDPEYDTDYGSKEFQAAVWDRNYARSLRGRKGQAALRELRDALRALSPRRLIEGFCETTIDDDGNEVISGVCAIGAMYVARGLPVDNYMQSEDFSSWDTADVGESMGMSNTMAFGIAYRNDETYSDLTPESRWWAMYAWVLQQIREVQG